jgi:hypothetical protein
VPPSRPPRSTAVSSCGSATGCWPHPSAALPTRVAGTSPGNRSSPLQRTAVAGEWCSAVFTVALPVSMGATVTLLFLILPSPRRPPLRGTAVARESGATRALRGETLLDTVAYDPTNFCGEFLEYPRVYGPNGVPSRGRVTRTTGGLRGPVRRHQQRIRESAFTRQADTSWTSWNRRD